MGLRLLYDGDNGASLRRQTDTFERNFVEKLVPLSLTCHILATQSQIRNPKIFKKHIYDQFGPYYGKYLVEVNKNQQTSCK